MCPLNRSQIDCWKDKEDFVADLDNSIKGDDDDHDDRFFYFVGV